MATACLTGAFYLTLSCGALFCVTTHGGHRGSQHSQNHSLLCVWSCQTNNSVSLVSLAAPLLVVLGFLFLVNDPSIVSAGIPRSRHFPRGPPTR